MANKLTVLLSIFLFVITLIPIGSQMFTPGGLERVSIVSIIRDPNYYKWKDTFIGIYAKHPDMTRKVFFNQKTALVMTALGQLLEKYFSASCVFQRNLNLWAAASRLKYR